ncbi:unnamed protein product [Tilletia laevis]|uniref:Cytochrome c oxidase subunit n=1 Tax=Tilletia caries TaxID=13290 RepID=A0A177V8N4_9BASI|nr:hypothetical protein CF336_g5631 [Tilletia laevis]KAE8192896.1 hypothetical protein CF328_g5212 [Tilletia controversa]KAE8243995.1 hypothetical protein A4X03_0g7641 [Tilletia caries]KAE8196681.1 hypothetical protein CF335_g4797 [Tilletia laevis]CAD6886907.1 unnamed protein product [Tilletia caries]
MSDSETSATTFTLQTASFDARFPNQNQNKHCYQNYLDYFRCINAKGEEHTPCKHFYRKYHSLCPNEWIAKWDEQRENNAFPASLEP